MALRDKGFTRARQAVHVWALLTAAATLLLLCSGGIVTSKGVGMAVPDWPTTYGYNMFLFPFERWVGGIFYEHSHRLIASGVGFMTLVLAAALLAVEPRRWVRHLGLAAFFAVCIQGLLGGLRVTLYKDEIGIFHALLAQAFFCSLGLLVVATSRGFIEKAWDAVSFDTGLRRLAIAATVTIFLQLGIGATMRHEHAGLAIPDFPTAYGQWIPDTSPQHIADINVQRTADGQMPTSALFIWVQMVHRVVAVVICALVLTTVVRAFRTQQDLRIRALSAGWALLIGLQFFLGAWTIWSGKAPWVATAHVAFGALALLTGVLLSFRLIRAGRPVSVPSPADAQTFAHFA